MIDFSFIRSIVAHTYRLIGFGYDPVFLIPALDKTMAELDSDHKNGLSHRGKAMAAFIASRCWLPAADR